MTHSPPLPAGGHQRRVRLEFLIALAGAFAAGLMAYSLTLLSRQDDSHQQMLTESGEMRERLLLAHLWLEHALVNPASVRAERDVLGNLDYAIHMAATLAESTEVSETFTLRRHRVAKPQAPDAVALANRLKELRAAAEELLRLGRTTADTPADKRFDQLFLASLEDAHAIDAAVHSLVDRDRIESARLQLLVLAALLVLFGGLVGLVMQNRRADAARQAELEHRVAERTAALRVEIAERQRSEEDVRQLNRRITEVNESLARGARLKDEFLAAMSHELRTPLNAILGFTELLLEGIQGEVNEKQAKSLRSVDESGRHLLSLINDILDLSKIEAGQLEIYLADTAIEPVCQASLRFVRQAAAKKRLHLTMEIDSRLSAVPADERRLRQILVNLLSNAVKFTPEDGKVGLTVTLLPEEDTVQFTVWDTGIGITPEDQAKLFKPFIQLDSRLSRQYTGTGLGLSMVLRLAELHGGRVALASEPGKGSRFSVCLPARAAASPSPRPPAVEAPAAAAFPTLRERQPVILLVEDNAANREMIQGYLTAQGCTVTVAPDGHAGLTEAARLRPAVVLMDVQMPGMDGLEATRRLKAAPETASIPVIALTALAMTGDRERCLAAGADDYLTKPVNLKQLAALLDRLLRAPRKASS